MPTSLLEQWPAILRLLKDAPRPAGAVLDVGPGFGKGAVLLREYVSTVQRVDAVEAEAGYVKAHSLDDLYGVVQISRFEEMDEYSLRPYDTILMVDVIEHMPKPEALAALDRCTGQIVICTPCVYEETWRPGMPQSERHLSLWCSQDFTTSRHPLEVADIQYGGWLIRLGPRGM